MRRWINTLWVGGGGCGAGVCPPVYRPYHVWRQAGCTGDTVRHEPLVAADQGRHVSQGECESSLIRYSSDTIAHLHLLQQTAVLLVALNGGIVKPTCLSVYNVCG